MRLKERPQDFKVTERLVEGVLQPRGEHRVYRVSKRKRTSLEAARFLARELGVPPAEVHMLGLKDRQGQTVQHMSVQHGRDLRYSDPELRIETVGSADHALSSGDSEGNEFQIVVRDLGPREIDHLRGSLDDVRTHGLPNYFDDQRFGNLRHRQGWIALDLLRGDVEGALKRLLAGISPHDPQDVQRIKQRLWQRWGHWSDCRELAGVLGRHHSVFEHLRRDPEDFAGAFGRVATRERLIHLFAFQSHLWNRAVSRWLDDELPPRDKLIVRQREGKLVFPRGDWPAAPTWGGTFPLPGAHLEGCVDDLQRQLLTQELERHGLRPEDFVIEGVPGFAFKAEARPLVVHPEGLRARPADEDRLFRGRKMVSLSFALPRGAYATLVVRRLVGAHVNEDDDRPRFRSRGLGGGGRRRGGFEERGRGGYGDRGRGGYEDRGRDDRDDRGRGGRGGPGGRDRYDDRRGAPERYGRDRVDGDRPRRGGGGARRGGGGFRRGPGPRRGERRHDDWGPMPMEGDDRGDRGGWERDDRGRGPRRRGEGGRGGGRGRGGPRRGPGPGRGRGPGGGSPGPHSRGYDARPEDFRPRRTDDDRGPGGRSTEGNDER